MGSEIHSRYFYLSYFAFSLVLVLCSCIACISYILFYYVCITCACNILLLIYYSHCMFTRMLLYIYLYCLLYFYIVGTEASVSFSLTLL